MKILASFLLAVLATIVATAALVLSQSTPASCGPEGVSNPFPVNYGKPTFVRSAPNGKRYTAGVGADNFTILHLYGTPYQMGYAQGQLMAAEINATVPLFTKYVEYEIEKALPSLPEWIVAVFSEYGITGLLDLTIDLTKSFTPQHFIDELQGLADGSGVPMNTVYGLNLFPELIKAACTITLAHNKATPSGMVNHLRALDFGIHNPIKDFPQITVYHFDGSDGVNKYQVANFGWTMLIGSLTGISSATVGLGEKVWDNHPKGVDSSTGKPWMFIDRDVLSQTASVKEAEAMIQAANRTCAIHLGLGDSTTNSIAGLQIAGHWFKEFNSSSLNYPGHPIIPGVVYWNKHAQPSSWDCLAGLLQNYYGNITAENLALEVAPKSTTGNFHAVTFDYQKLVAYFANSQKTYITEGNINAYARQYTYVDVKALFAEPKP